MKIGAFVTEQSPTKDVQVVRVYNEKRPCVAGPLFGI